VTLLRRHLLKSAVLAAALSLPLSVAQAADREIGFAFGAPILTLDPGVSNGTPAQTARIQVMETLVEFDPETLEVRPLLAERWETADDNVTWTFHLRPGVKFHDGSPLTAHDVAASINRIIAPDSGFGRASHLRDIAEISAVNDLTVKVVTKAPSGAFLRMMALDTASVLSAASLEKYGEDVGWNPVGTGPFKYVSHVPEQSITMERNDDYWGKKPEVEKIVFQTVPEPATRLAMLETGEIDVITEVPGFDVERLRDLDGVSLIERSSTRLGHVGINTKQAPFDNPVLRQALSHAIDQDAIIAGVLRGLGVPADSIIAPTVNGYGAQKIYGYDPELAKAKLAEAGFGDGLDVTIWTPQGRYFMDRETVVAIQAMLRAVGVNANVEVIDWSTYLSELRVPDGENKSQLYWLGWESGTADIQYILDTVFDSGRMPPNGWNTMFYENPQVDALRVEMSKELDPERRQKLAEEAQALIVADAPWIPVYAYVQVTAYNSDIEDMKFLPTDTYILKDITFK